MAILIWHHKHHKLHIKNNILDKFPLYPWLNQKYHLKYKSLLKYQ